MSDHDREKLEFLFHQVSQLAPEKIPPFLDRVAQDEPGLSARLERLLELDSEPKFRSAGFAEPDTDGCGSVDSEDAPVPERIGPYRIVRRIASGGMGTVYEATEEHPRRTVALKVVRGSVASASALRRLEAESHILAQLQHPGIAQVFAAGVYEVGGQRLPYFAMEHVAGALSVTEYASRYDLSLRQKLGLFVQICDAVSHGHRKGIIHRDLKPDNVLVDPESEPVQPKVIDFGVARATDSDFAVTTMATTSGQLIGTLRYMSPEQLEADPSKVDIRCDVYALGLLVHELIADGLPYEVTGLPLDEAIRLIRQEVPRRLSTTHRQLSGDVETIVLKALEKEPDRRYESAAALSADVRAYLDRKPIQARPPSSLYYLRVFTRRNKVPVAAAALIFAMAIVATVVSTRFAIQANHASTLATQRADEAERQAYRSNLTFASEAVAVSRWAEAEHLLEDAPPRLRGWEWQHLSSRLEQSIRTHSLEESPIYSGVASSDGAWALAVTNDNVAVLADLRTGARRRLETPSASGYPGNEPCWFHPDGTRAYVRGLTETETWVRSWRLGPEGVTEESTVRLPGGSSWFMGDFDPARARLAQASGAHPMESPEPVPGLLRVDDIEAGRTIAEFDLGERVYSQPICFSPSGRWLATSYYVPGDFVRFVLIDARDWSIRGQLTLPQVAQGIRVAFSSDEERLCAGGEDGVLRILEFRGDRLQQVATRKTGSNVITALSYVSNGSVIASTSATDLNVHLWSAEDLSPLGVFRGHQGVLKSLDARRDSDEFLSFDTEGGIRVWNASALDPFVLRGHASYVYPVALTRDQSMIVSGGWDGFVDQAGCLRWWDRATGEPVVSLGEPGWQVHHVVTSPADDILYVSIRDMSSDPLLPRVVKVDPATGELTPIFIGEVDDFLEGLDLDPEGKRLAVVGYRGTVRILDADTGAQLFSRRLGQGGWDRFCRVRWGPDGRALAVSEGGRVELWDAAGFDVLDEWQAHDALIWSLTFDSVGERLATTSRDGTARVWDARAGDLVATLAAHDSEVLCAAFSPDGQRLATGGRARAIHLWETEEYTTVAKLAGHESYVYSLVWSDDGQTLVSGSGDGTVRVWDKEPAPVRVAARERRTQMRADLGPRVVDALARVPDPRRAREILAADETLTRREREIALQILLRRSRAAETPSPARVVPAQRR